MKSTQPPKYGLALTGSDWVGLPLRIGHNAESGMVEDLSSSIDSLLIWSGGVSDVNIQFHNPQIGESDRIEFTRSSGSMDLLPRGTKLHRVQWSGEPTTCVSISLPESCLRALNSTHAGGLDAKRGPQFSLLDAHVVDLANRLQVQAEGTESLGAVYIQSISLTLASYVLARYGEKSTTSIAPRKGSLSTVQRQAITTFVEQEIASNFGLVDLASLVGYCPDHFSRLFKIAFEQSPHQYVLSRRVEKAMTMLRDDGRSIAEIARDCGFSSQGHLSAAFKRRTGMSPGAYRKC